MKRIIVFVFLLLVTSSCNDTSSEPKSIVDENNPTSEMIDNTEMQDSEGFVEENDACICTKEFRPVCGENNKTYPNPCMAGCDGVEVFTDGSCED